MGPLPDPRGVKSRKGMEYKEIMKTNEVSEIDTLGSADPNHITTCTCDTCGVTGPVVVLHHYGSPVLAQCKVCGPHSFEVTARRDIDVWLAGG